MNSTTETKTKHRSSGSALKHLVMRDPSAQIKAWINDSYEQWQFWLTVVSAENYDGLDKTKEQAENLVGYYEGQYDLACDVRDFVSQQTVSDGNAFDLGTTFKKQGRKDKDRIYTVEDIYTTTNIAGHVVKQRYVASSTFCGQKVTDRDIPSATIARGRCDA